jgi:hypothetical protein
VLKLIGFVLLSIESVENGITANLDYSVKYNTIETLVTFRYLVCLKSKKKKVQVSVTEQPNSRLYHRV